MNADSSQLPWKTLEQKEGDIPWSALRTFAEAVVSNADVIQKLFDVYKRGYEIALDETCYADLYVPAIFSLAAPQLDDEQRRQIGAFLVAKLVAAGRDNDTLGLEVLTAAAGTMGPAILPTVLDAIARKSDPRGAWVFLWDLTLLAGETKNATLREPVVQACVNQLERADRGETELWEAEPAACTLGTLKCTEHTDLLRRLGEKEKEAIETDDYGYALKLLEGRLDDSPTTKPWEEPVENWLTSKWRIASDEYTQYQNEEDADSDALDCNLGAAGSLAIAFTVSPIARGLPKALRLDAIHIVERLISYSFTYLDAEPNEWDESMLRELLLDIVPREMLADQALLEKIGPVTEAFLVWLGFEGMMADARTLAATVHHWNEEIVTAGLDPEKWDLAKTFAMRTLEKGLDPTDPEIKKQFINGQVQEFLNAGAIRAEPDPLSDEPPIPIVASTAKVGRNAPCPCGSGRKYKKCCGSPTGKGTAKA